MLRVQRGRCDLKSAQKTSSRCVISDGRLTTGNDPYAWMMRRTAKVGLGLMITLVVAACSSADKRAAESGTPSNMPATVVPANYEIIAGQPTRFLAGLLLSDGRVVVGGSVQMRFAPLDDSGAVTAPASEPVPGTYLAADPADAAVPGDTPMAASPESTPGVYEVEGATFPTPGSWVVEVAARVEGVGVVQGSAPVDVVAKPVVPGPGDRAPRTDNAVIGDPGVPDDHIDSRALDGRPIPDPSLHHRSIADALRRGRPAVVLFSTPTYCQSRFCGPVTDMVEDLSRAYGDRAEFIHVEVWQNFDASVANPAATDWLLEDGELNEPWLFIIDDDGRIVARWDNLVIREEVEEAVQGL